MQWSDLNMSERDALMKLYLKNGITSLSAMKEHYNSYATGGYKKDPPKDPVLKDRKPNANFYQRLIDKFRQTIPSWENRITSKNDVATHKMSWVTDNKGNAIVYPEVQEINGKLYDFTDPRNQQSKRAAFDRAIETGDTIMMTPEQANFWTQHYKEFYPSFNYATGGSIEDKTVHKYQTGGHFYDGDNPNGQTLDIGPTSTSMRLLGQRIDEMQRRLNSGNSTISQVSTNVGFNQTPQQIAFAKELEKQRAEQAKLEEERKAEARKRADQKLHDDLSGKNGFWTIVGASLQRAGDPLTSGSPSIIADDAQRLEDVGLTDEANRLRALSTAIGLTGLGAYTLPTAFGAATNVALNGSRTALGAAGKMMLPSTWTTAAGLSSGWGTAADAAMFTDMVYHGGKNLLNADNWSNAGRYGTYGFRTPENYLNLGLDLASITPVFRAVKGGVNLASDITNFARNWRLNIPKSSDRYYRYVGDDAIADYIRSGVIRASGANPDFQRATVMVGDKPVQLGKTFDYSMFSKGKPWEGSLSSSASTVGKKAKQLNILRSKADTGPTIWEESNIDFRHKGHAGIFRPNYFGDLNATPTDYFEWWEPKKLGYLRHEFPASSQPKWLGKYTSDNPRFGTFIDEGSESAVYDNGDNVLKINFERSDNTVNEMLEHANKTIENRNSVSEQIPISLEGFVSTLESKPKLHAVYKQEKIGSTYDLDEPTYQRMFDDLAERLRQNGWIMKYKDKYYNPELNKTLLDVTRQNVGVKDGKLYIFDGYVEKKGGKLEK